MSRLIRGNITQATLAILMGWLALLGMIAGV